MVSCQVDPGSWDEGSKPLHKFHGREFDGKSAIVPRLFQSVDDFPSHVGRESFFGKSGPGNVPANLFELISVEGFGGDSGVK